MSLLDTVEPDGYRMFDGGGNYDFREELPDQVSIGWSLRYGRLWEEVYSRETVESLLEAQRAAYEEGLTELQQVLTKISEFNPPDTTVDLLGESEKMTVRLHNAEVGDTARAGLEILRRMAESDKTTMEGEK